MKNNKCQAYTKKRIPCKNNALEGSQLCSFHEGFFEDFPPVKITALFCPYCDEPLRRGAKFCELCKNSLLICRYCHEPLKKDSKFCSFCKEDLTPIEPKPLILKSVKPNVYGRLIDDIKLSAAKAMNISIDWSFVVFFLLLSFFTILFAVDIYLNLVE